MLRSVVHVFTRNRDRDAFTYQGRATPYRAEATTPVTVIWDFGTARPERLPEEVPSNGEYWEGAATTITVDAYERNPEARRACIEHWGSACVVCKFDFEHHYGALGRGYIHVHHLKSIVEIGKEYKVDPGEGPASTAQIGEVSPIRVAKRPRDRG